MQLQINPILIFGSEAGMAHDVLICMFNGTGARR